MVHLLQHAVSDPGQQIGHNSDSCCDFFTRLCQLFCYSVIHFSVKMVDLSCPVASHIGGHAMEVGLVGGDGSQTFGEELYGCFGGTGSIGVVEY